MHCPLCGTSSTVYRTDTSISPTTRKVWRVCRAESCKTSFTVLESIDKILEKPLTPLTPEQILLLTQQLPEDGQRFVFEALKKSA